jgi:hypothetical protein
MKVKLYQQNCGSKIAVGIEGNEKDVTDRFNSFWNHGATDGEFHWQTLTRGYFWTTTEKLKKAIFNATLFELWNNHPEMEDDEPASEALAHPIANARFETVENKPDLVSFSKNIGAVYATEVDLEDYNWNGSKKARN